MKDDANSQCRQAKHWTTYSNQMIETRHRSPRRPATAPITSSAWQGPNKHVRVHAQLSKFFTDPQLDFRANERVVAVVIFQHVNLRTMQSYPSIDTICRRAKVSRNTVCRTIKKLQELRLMKVIKKRDGGKYSRNVYDFSALLSK